MDINFILSNQLVNNPTINQHLIIFKAPEFYKKGFTKVKTDYMDSCVANYIKTLKCKYDIITTYAKLKQFLVQKKIKEIKCYTLNDYTIHNKIKKICKITEFNNPMFLNSKERNLSLLSKNKLLFTSFYIEQRKHYKILLKKNGTPVGDKWTFDTENRQPMSAELSSKLKETPLFAEDRSTALAVLKNFIKKKIKFFGKYQDYVDSRHLVMFHSALSAPLNIGIITPRDILKEVFNCDAPIQSLEGFIRQIIGWREFICGLYQVHYTKLMKSNFFKHKNAIPKSFYTGTTGIIPLDNSIKRFREYGYVHHIERLMIIGNLFMLCEVHPLQVMKWFTELSIDAYDWVMVSNVLVMSQFACGPFATTKPYFSSSAYILRMSNYKKDPKWCTVWDALFWRFMKKNQTFLKSNPRLAYLTRYIASKATPTVLAVANKFIKTGRIA